jgi:hypothetical protein
MEVSDSFWSEKRIAEWNGNENTLEQSLRNTNTNKITIWKAFDILVG